MIFRGINRNLLIVSLISFCVLFCSSVSAKTIKYNKRVYYDGEVQKKKPFGNGVLIVGDKAFRGIDDIPYIHDKITGTFDGLSVTNGVLIFSTGIKFKGNFTIDVSDESVSYYLNDGVFDGFNYNCYSDGYNNWVYVKPVYKRRYSFYEHGVSLSLKESVKIQRTIKEKDFSLQSNEFISSLSIDVNPEIYLEKEYSRCFEYAYSLAFAFVNEKKSATIHSKVKTEISPAVALDLDADDVTIDFGDNYVCTYSYSPDYDRMTIRCNNGDSLVWLRTGKNATLNFKKTVNNNGSPYTIECINHSQRLAESGLGHLFRNPEVYNQYDYIVEKLGSYINNDTKERIHNAHDGVKKYKMLIKDDWYGGEPYKYTFNDGSYFIGFLNSEYVSNTLNFYTVPTILMSKDEPNDKMNWLCGIHFLPTGEQTIYLKGKHGWTLDALEEAIKAEEKCVENEDRRKKAKEEQERKRWNELYNKYGQKYVDAIFKQNKILVGMPEQLLIDGVSNLKLWTETQYLRTYKVYNNWNTDWLMTVTVNKSTKKVESVINY